MIIGDIPIHRWDEMAKGFFEAIVDETLSVGFKAVNAREERMFSQALYQRNFLCEDVADLFKDYGSKVATLVNLLSNNSINKRRWLYKIMPTMNILVGADPMDIEVDPLELEPLPVEPEEDYCHVSND